MESKNTPEYNDSDDDLSIGTATLSNTGAHKEGILASDGVFIEANAAGHVDLDQLQKHQKTLHEALYVDPPMLDALDTLEIEYQNEFIDHDIHVPFSHPDLHHHHIVDFTPAMADSDHYDFHHSHEEGIHDHKAGDLLIKGIDVAQRQNDEGLINLYRGQKMCLDAKFKDAIIQLEKSLEFYRHLHLSHVGDEDNHSSTSSVTSKDSRNMTSKELSQHEEFIAERDRLDFCPHIYGILVEC